MTKKLLFALAFIALTAATAASDNACSVDNLSPKICAILKPFGFVIAKAKASGSGPSVYYFQMTGVNFPSTTVPMIIPVTCTVTSDSSNSFCSAGTVSGAPPNFPPAFIAPGSP